MIDLKQYGYAETGAWPGLLPGRITDLRRGQYTVVTPLGEVAAVLKGTFMHDAQAREDYPCIGDFVLLAHNESGLSRIVRLLPRRSKFSRADFSGHKAEYVKTIREQVIVANFDTVFILSSLNGDLNVSRILRYLTQARQSGGRPVVLLTKADLVADFEKPLADVRQAVADVPVYALSSLTGLGMDALGAYLLPGQTVVFLGMSGVGKSSLLNALMQTEVMPVQAIREDDSRGRHTTTHRQLFMLPCGAMVIDTPGMRELGLFDAAQGLQANFADVEALQGNCRFSNCRHRTEPGCAVLAALADGSLTPARWERYLAQRREDRFVAGKSARSAKKADRQAEKKPRNKALAPDDRPDERNGGTPK